MSFLEWFRNGGTYMFFVLFADIAAIVLIIVLLMLSKSSRSKLYLIIIIGVGLLPLFIGAFGNWVGYLEIMSALPMVDPAQKQELYNESMAVARIPSIFGGISSAVLLLIGIPGLRLLSRYR